MNRFVFFLGGHDLEMLTIRDLLETNVPFRFHDKGLSWGAKTSDYSEEIGTCLGNGDVPVLIELQDDLGLDLERVVIIDHHGERAGIDRPTSLHQVFDLLGLPSERWSRWFELVAANDRGYIPAMREAGATQEEILKVRAADRAAQGITAEEEAQGAQAIDQAEVRANGRLTLVCLPHSRTATVTDRLEPALGGPGYQNLLVISPCQLNFFGKGQFIFALNRSFPGGWYGGALPERGFCCPRVPPVMTAGVSSRFTGKWKACRNMRSSTRIPSRWTVFAVMKAGIGCFMRSPARTWWNSGA